MEKVITYFGQPARVKCDEKCHKAWGSWHRPRIYPQISEDRIFGLNGSETHPGHYEDWDDSIEFDADNYAYCSDDELPDAPRNPGTSEGDDFKPVNKKQIGNRWCVRACERCAMSKPGEYDAPLELPDFSKRLYNMKQPPATT